MGTFTLNQSLLGGSHGEFGYDEQIIEDRGRSIVLTWTSTGLDDDIELFGYSVRLAAAESEPKERV